jgi:hypothetical protein
VPASLTLAKSSSLIANWSSAFVPTTAWHQTPA